MRHIFERISMSATVVGCEPIQIFPYFQLWPETFSVFLQSLQKWKEYSVGISICRLSNIRAKLLITDRRNRLKDDIIEACECYKAWCITGLVDDTFRDINI